MTADLAAAAEGVTAAPAVDAVVAVLGEHLLGLSARARVAPSLVRVSAGDVTVEMGWTTCAHTGSAATVAPWALPAAEPGASVAPTAGFGPAAPPAPQLDASSNGTAATPATSSTAVPATTFPLCSSSVGVFYRSPEPGAAAFVAEGDVVQAGQQVAIVEAMKLMIPLTAERSGRVVSILVDDASPVEHGQPLFLLEPLSGGSVDGA